MEALAAYIPRQNPLLTADRRITAGQLIALGASSLTVVEVLIGPARPRHGDLDRAVQLRPNRPQGPGRSPTEAPWSAIGPNGLTGDRLGDLVSDFDLSSARPRLPLPGLHRRLGAVLPAPVPCPACSGRRLSVPEKQMIRRSQAN